MAKNIAKLALIFISFAPIFASASLDVNLRYGSSGSQVVELQDFLYSKRFISIAPTGNFYTLTRNAVIQYQNAVGLPATGFVGPLTREKINTELIVADRISNEAEVKETFQTGAPQPVITNVPNPIIDMPKKTEVKETPKETPKTVLRVIEAQISRGTIEVLANFAVNQEGSYVIADSAIFPLEGTDVSITKENGLNRYKWTISNNFTIGSGTFNLVVKSETGESVTSKTVQGAIQSQGGSVITFTF